MTTKPHDTDFTTAVQRSVAIRNLYHELEKRNHGGAWTNQEDMIGFVHDVGELGKMVMAAEGRWLHPGDLGKDLQDKLSECLWWIFTLSDRLGVDLTAAFSSKMAELEEDLSTSLEHTDSTISHHAPAPSGTDRE